jgi:hypothetical protein
MTPVESYLILSEREANDREYSDSQTLMLRGYEATTIIMSGENAN